jgi:hypothetical protein
MWKRRTLYIIKLTSKKVVRPTFGARAQRIFSLRAIWRRIQFHAPFDKKVNGRDCHSWCGEEDIFSKYSLRESGSSSGFVFIHFTDDKQEMNCMPLFSSLPKIKFESFSEHKHNLNQIVMCRIVRVTKWRVLARMIGFIGTLVTTSIIHTQIQAIQVSRWFTHFTFQRCKPTRIPSLH